MPLPLARYRFTFRMAAPLRLPHYAGSLLRGQFGAALRRVSCITGAASCEGCLLRSTCPYPAVFEAPAPATHALQRFSQIPNPYVIEPPALGTTRIEAGQALCFKLVLIGHALERLPLIVVALQRMIEQGLGSERTRGVLEQIDIQPGSEPIYYKIWQTGDNTIAPHSPAHFPTWREAPLTATPSAIRLVFDTPLRLQHQGRPVRPAALTPRKLVADLLRRITLLAEFHADRPGLIADAPALVRHAETLEQQLDLRWHDWSRYSSRQQQEMTLGGALGSWILRGELEPLLPWLQLGQWLHIGKNATMGLGQYRLLPA